MKATLLCLALLAAPLVADETLREKLAARAAESAKSGDPAVQAAYARGSKPSPHPASSTA